MMLAASIAEVVFAGSSQARDASLQDTWQSLPVQAVLVTMVPSGTGESAGHPRDALPVAQVRSKYDIDHIYVPPPEVSRAEAAMAADSRTIGPISKALHSYEMTPEQLISVRNYIGQYGDKTEVVAAGTYHGVSVFGLKDPKTGEYVGQIQVRAGDNGEVIVSKAQAAQFEREGKIEVPILGKVDKEEAQKVLGGDAAYTAATTEEEKLKGEVELPKLAKIEGNADFGRAREATAHFFPDGSGEEYGLVTKIGSAKAEATVHEGISVGAGARGPEVEGYVNYFGRPKADAEGRFTRAVIGGSVELHGTLAEVQAKFGCSDEEACGAKIAAGALGVGAGFGLSASHDVSIPVRPLNEGGEPGAASAPAPAEAEAAPQITYAPHVDVPVAPQSDVEPGGVAEAEAPPPPSAEDQQAYEQAEQSGDSALQSFIAAHPDSPLAGVANDQVDFDGAARSNQPLAITGY